MILIFVKSVIIIATIISLLLYMGHLNYNPQNSRFEYPIIILISLLGMLVLVSANDFLTLYMGLEMQSIAVYILVAINRNNIKSSEAGIKYFVLGALSSGIILYGISLIYGFTGSIFFNDIANIFTADNIQQQPHYLGLLIGLILILIALLLKFLQCHFTWTRMYMKELLLQLLYILALQRLRYFLLYLVF